jgi:hypothetical protein
VRRSDKRRPISLIGEQLRGESFTARAKPFAEFELCFGEGQVLLLRYIFDAEIEKLGGIAYQCEYDPRRWNLQFFRTPYLQRESYRVLCEGSLVVTTDVLRIRRSVDVTYSDGVIWHCRTSILGTVVTDSEGNRILHSRPRPVLLGASSIQVDGSPDHERVLPMLIILLHYTTHTNE